jgi:alkylresorcinol/alkylpyrone synthase
MPYIASSAIAPCPHGYDQADLMDFAGRFFAEGLDVEQYAGIFESVGIRRRHFVLPVEELVDGRGWLERCRVFAGEAARLGEEALKSALETGGMDPADLGHLYFISTTGIATPSVDARILGHPPWNPATLRTPIWGLGCSGGVSGLARAADWVAQHPDRAAAVLAAEFCSLTFHSQDFSLSNFVAAALFGDGVACSVVVGDELAARLGIERFRIAGHRVRLFQDSLDVMGWDPVESGLQLVFSRKIPSYARNHAREEFDSLVEESAVAPDKVKLFLGHPGGPKILSAYEEALGWPRERFRFAWKVLEDWGNMSSATVLYVLTEAFEQNLDGNGDEAYALIAGLGPGFSSEQLLAGLTPSPAIRTSRSSRLLRSNIQA